MCTIEHVGRIRNNLNSTLAGEWGLSLRLESQAGGATGQYLLDFGYTPEILVRNFDLLGGAAAAGCLDRSASPSVSTADSTLTIWRFSSRKSY